MPKGGAVSSLGGDPWKVDVSPIFVSIFFIWGDSLFKVDGSEIRGENQRLDVQNPCK